MALTGLGGVQGRPIVAEAGPDAFAPYRLLGDRAELVRPVGQIALEPEAFAVLRDDANGVVPGLFPATSSGSSKPAEKADACSVNSDLRSCFIAGCTWSDAQCEATQK